MDKIKYIPGDIVKLNNEVVTIAETNLFCYSIIDSGGDFYTNVVYNIKPILLTSEIFEKNGWGKCNITGALKNHYIGYFKNQLNVYFREDKTEVFIKGKEVPLQHSLKYVHQLQHLLFGLGLNSKMEV